MVDYTFEQTNLDDIIKIRIGGQAVDTKGRLKKSYTGTLEDVSVIEGRTYVNIEVTGVKPSWILTLKWKQCEVKIERPIDSKTALRVKKYVRLCAKK